MSEQPANVWDLARRWVEEGSRLGLHRRIMVTIAYDGVLEGAHLTCRPCEEGDFVLVATAPDGQFTASHAERVLGRAMEMMDERQRLLILPPGVVVESLNPGPPKSPPLVEPPPSPAIPLWFVFGMAMVSYILGVVVGMFAAR